MSDLNKIINNPILWQAIKVVSPEIAIGVELVKSLFGKKTKNILLISIDKRIVHLLNELSKAQGPYYKQELEIRIHELLTLLNLYKSQ